MGSWSVVNTVWTSGQNARTRTSEIAMQMLQDEFGAPLIHLSAELYSSLEGMFSRVP
jgi:hypothetical protein